MGKSAYFLSVAGGIMLTTGPVFAQGVSDNSTQGVGRSEANGGLDEIVVTAQKRETNIQNTALAVTALSGSDLDRQGIVNANDLQGLAPGANFIGSSTSMNIAIRGITSTGISSSVSTDPAVSVFVDGVVTARQNSAGGVLFDLERVEVLRGPQGTLWGRNNTAGAVNFVTRRPTFDLSGRASVDVGNYSSLAAEGVVNVPVSEQLAIRAAVRGVRHDPYFKNGYGDQNDMAARLRVLYQPSSRLTILATVDYLHNGGKGGTSSPYPPGSNLSPVIPGGTSWDPWRGLPLCAGAFPSSVAANNCIASDGKIDDTNIGVYAEITLDMDWATLTYLPGYRRVETDDLRYVGTGFTRQEVHQTDEWSSHEVRLSNSRGSGLSWVVGLYSYDEHFSGILSNYPQNGGYFTSSTPDANSRSIAAFGEITYPVTDTLRLTAGLRHTRDEKNSIGQSNYVVPVLNGTPPANRAINSPAGEWNQTNFKVGAEFDAGPSSMFYFDVSTGYKAGGFFNAYANNTFEPEQIVAMQGGAKNRFFDNQLQLNFDAFYYDYRNYQVSTATLGQFNAPPAPPSFGLLTLNSKKARFFGAELESRWAISPNDRLEGSLTLLSADWTEFVLPSADLSGFRPTFAPTMTARLAYEHVWDLNDGGSVIGRVQTAYSSSYWVLFSHVPGSLQNSYTKTNMELTYVSPDSDWEFTIYGRNLENEATLGMLIPPNAITPVHASVDAPRTFGARITARF